jgi:hypothetical protein
VLYNVHIGDGCFAEYKDRSWIQGSEERYRPTMRRLSIYVWGLGSFEVRATSNKKMLDERVPLSPESTSHQFMHCNIKGPGHCRARLCSTWIKPYLPNFVVGIRFNLSFPCFIVKGNLSGYPPSSTHRLSNCCLPRKKSGSFAWSKPLSSVSFTLAISIPSGNWRPFSKSCP